MRKLAPTSCRRLRDSQPRRHPSSLVVYVRLHIVAPDIDFLVRLAMMGKQKDAKKKPSKGQKNNEKGPKKDVGVQAVSDLYLLYTHHKV